jgi:hypothetical protein
VQPGRSVREHEVPRDATEFRAATDELVEKRPRTGYSAKSPSQAMVRKRNSAGVRTTLTMRNEMTQSLRRSMSACVVTAVSVVTPTPTAPQTMNAANTTRRPGRRISPPRASTPAPNASTAMSPAGSL